MPDFKRETGAIRTSVRLIWNAADSDPFAFGAVVPHIGCAFIPKSLRHAGIFVPKVFHKITGDIIGFSDFKFINNRLHIYAKRLRRGRGRGGRGWGYIAEHPAGGMYISRKSAALNH